MKHYNALMRLETALIDMDGLAPLLYAVADSCPNMMPGEIQSALYRLETMLKQGLTTANCEFQTLFEEVRDTEINEEKIQPPKPTKKGTK